MWQPVKVEDNHYAIKKLSTHGHHTVLLTNFVNIWGEEVTTELLYGRCKVRSSLEDIAVPVKYSVM
jgi:hypothetical protein